MQIRIGFNRHRSAEVRFHFFHNFTLSCSQRFSDVRRHTQHHIAFTDQLFGYGLGLLEYLEAHGLRRLHHSSALTVWTRRAEGALERLLDSLASDGNQTEIVDRENLRR